MVFVCRLLKASRYCVCLSTSTCKEKRTELFKIHVPLLHPHKLLKLQSTELPKPMKTINEIMTNSIQETLLKNNFFLFLYVLLYLILFK
jgi:hypothetical protein